MLDPCRWTGQLPAGWKASADEAELHRMHGERLVQLYGRDKGRTDATAALCCQRPCFIWLLQGK